MKRWDRWRENLDIKVKDTDGIDFITIEIPVLNINERIDDYSSDNKWKLSKSYPITDVTQTSKYKILLYLTDRTRVEYLEEEEFRIRSSAQWRLTSFKTGQLFI